MTIFTTDELNLITLYDSGTRRGTIYELREMTGYLLPDEADLLVLAEGVIGKLESMSDEDYEKLSMGSTCFVLPAWKSWPGRRCACGGTFIRCWKLRTISCSRTRHRLRSICGIRALP